MAAVILEESTQGLVFAPAEDGEGVILTGLGKCKNNEEIILGTYQGKRIVGIGKGALKGGRFTTITLPPTVKFIEKGAFAKCADLERVHIFDLSAWCGIRFADGEANPLYYGQRLFLCGKELDRVAIPEGVKEIGAFAFYRFAGLVRLSLPKSLERIGNAAFSGCMGLTELSLPQGLREIGADAFSGCTGIEGELRLESLRCLGEYAFEGCKKIQAVVFYPCLEQFGKGVFLHCDSLEIVHFYGARTVWEEASKVRKKHFPSFTALTQDDGGVEIVLDESNAVHHVTDYGKTLKSITVPEGVTGIGHGAFRGCEGLAEIVIPQSVAFIGDWAFYGCTSLTSITVPEGVAKIGMRAFERCAGLTAITIPKSVTNIELGAFEYCASLTAITVEKGNPVYHSDGNCLIETESRTLIAGCKTSVIPTNGSVTKIWNYAFYGCTGLESITIPDSITSIEEYAFFSCTGLETVNYQGTADQWFKIPKRGGCLSDTPSRLVVQCTDRVFKPTRP